MTIDLCEGLKCSKTQLRCKNLFMTIKSLTDHIFRALTNTGVMKGGMLTMVEIKNPSLVTFSSNHMSLFLIRCRVRSQNRLVAAHKKNSTCQ